MKNTRLVSKRRAQYEETNKPTFSAQGARFVWETPCPEWLACSLRPAPKALIHDVFGLSDKGLSFDWVPMLPITVFFFYSHCISHLGYLKKTKQNSGSRGRMESVMLLLTSKSF